MPMSPPRDRHGEFVLYGIIHTVQRKASESDYQVTVIIPQFIPKKGWHNFLHNQSSLLIRAHLLYRRDVIITTVPYHFKNRGLFFCALYKESAPPTTKSAIIRSLLKRRVHRAYFPRFDYCQTYGIKKHSTQNEPVEQWR